MGTVDAPVVFQVNSEGKEQVIEVLTAAFYNYPVMRYVLDQKWPDYRQKLKMIVGFFAEDRVVKGLRPFVIRIDDVHVAAALVNQPVRIPTPPELRQALKHLIKEIGSENFGKLKAYEDKCEEMEPDSPHYYLGMIGVLPEHQGKGYARLMLDHVHQIVDDDPEAMGIALNTENPNNVPIYRRFAYEVIGEADVGPLHTWCMFRPSS